MARQSETGEIGMEHAAIAGTSLEVSRVALGTWAIGGWMWGGTDETESIATIRAAADHGINLIETAPAPRRAAARAAAALQSVRARHLGRPSPLLPKEQDRDLRLWRSLLRSLLRAYAAGQQIRWR